METCLSAYWVEFFKGAGFPRDVATKHAVVFSNNRIKPDMLPDLDKPSLKEMGIALMGDMIAILRYAKKVVEETTCRRFLVDSEEDTVPSTKIVAKPAIVKRVATKIPSASITTSKVKAEHRDGVRNTKNSYNAVSKSAVIKKKAQPSTAAVITRYVEKQKLTPVKRKLEIRSEAPESGDCGGVNDNDEDEDECNGDASKRSRVTSDEDDVGYKVIMPKGTTARSRRILKKVFEQKGTVFDRLGDSSVTSTTNLAEMCPTFNVTGLGKDVFKRNSSVFNRLGDKDAKKDRLPYVGILKNGKSNSPPPGILKNRPNHTGATTIVPIKKVVKILPKPVGTMRADREKKQKTVSSGAKQLVETIKRIDLTDDLPTTTKIIRKVATSSKLASERTGSIPAKQRLGVSATTATKQVTFNRIATVAHVKKPGVFSRLGV